VSGQGKELNVFAVILAFGAALGLLRISRQRSGQWLDAGLLILLAVLLGARAGFVFERFAYYSTQPAEIFLFQAGGLSGNGAVVGALAGLCLAAVIHRASPLRLADWLYPLIPSVGIAVYLACWQAGAAYGPQVPPGFWGVPSPDEGGQIAPRWPIQLLAALALIVFYWLIELRVPLPRPSGWLSSLALAWLIAIDLVVSLLRAAPAPRLAGLELRLDSIGDVFLLILFLGIFTILNFRSRKISKPVTSL
jgi:phosphatidylglycerol---prolipoprotein diacylglyceryl transferase